MNTVKVSHERGKVQQEIRIGAHHLVADVGPEGGGEDAGPSPHDYLTAALGACTGLTLKLYAQRKNWPLENAEITVSLAKEGDVTKFERVIRLIGALDDEQKARLMDIANRCPVHQTLSGKIQIETKQI